MDERVLQHVHATNWLQLQLGTWERAVYLIDFGIDQPAGGMLDDYSYYNIFKDV